MAERSLENIITDLVKSNSEQDKSVFYELTHKPLYKYCLILSHKPEVADDLLHDTYLKAFKNIKGLSDKTKCNAWLKKIAKNLFLDLLKKAYVKNETDIFEDKFISNATDDNLMLHDIVNTMQVLSVEFREAIYLIDMEGLDYTAAANIIGISAEAVKSRIYRARQHFIKVYNRDNITPGK